jgi:outer membrane protein assembly factor BamB
VVAEIDLSAEDPGRQVPRPNAPVLIDAGRVTVTADTGVAWCLDAETGGIIWKRELDGTLLPPSAGPGGVVLARSDGRLLLLDYEQGETRLEVATEFPLALTPLVREGVAYLAGPGGEAAAFNLEEKRLLWKAATGEPARALASGAGLLVVSGGQGTLTALSLDDGKARWSFRGEGAFEAPAVFDAQQEQLFVGDTGGTFYSLSAKEGKKRYRWKTGAAITVPILLHEKRVYVASQANTLFAYTEGGGHEQWRVDLPGRPASAPVVAGPFIAVATLTGEIVEFNTTTARRGGTPFKAPADIRAPPTLSPPRAAVLLRSGRLILLLTGHPPPPPTPTEVKLAARSPIRPLAWR